MIQTKTLKEALKDPGVIEVVEELIGAATPNNDGLLSKGDYSRTVPVHSYGSVVPKIVLKYPESTIDPYAHLLVLINNTMFKINYFSDSRECTSNRLFGNDKVTFYANKEKREIIFSRSGMINVKAFNAPTGMLISIETFKDGITPPTEEDGDLVKES